MTRIPKTFSTRIRGFLSRQPLGVWASVSLAVAACLMATGFWGMRRVHAQLAHLEAAQQVVDRGSALTEFFSGMLASRGTSWPGIVWARLGLLVESLHTAEERLQYVGITQGDETLFYRQTQEGERPVFGEVHAAERLLEVNGEIIPVMVFAQVIPREPGEEPWVVEVGLRREIVADAERVPNTLLESIYRFSLLIAGSALLVCLGLFVWAIRRDRRRETRRQREEHLMFSGMLANGIAHDFRNPMSSARLDAQMLAREAERDGGPRPERMRQLGSRISRTMERMDRIFQEFLYLGRPGDTAVETLPLLACLAESIETLTARAEQNGVTVRVDAPVGADSLRVHGEPFSLRRAFVNILMNAIEFSGPAHGEGHGEVTVRVTPGKARVVVDILDSGPGIPEEGREKIFEMFYTTRAEGTGLGLFLARTAVEKCGGKISAPPCETGGCIRVELRVAEGAALPQEKES